MKILITGSAGFIGYHLAAKLSYNKKYKVLGIDNFDNYYSINLKKKRLSILRSFKNFKFKKIDILNEKKLQNLFKKEKFDVVFHLAAQAGVRYSILNPKKYMRNNIQGFFNILETAKQNKIKRIIYASSSSVYGDSNIFPLTEKQILRAKNLYSLSKDFNEKLSSVYSNFNNLNLIGLRFFTAYGELGRPDMMMMKYINCKYSGKPFFLYNYGNHYRDFTYINDVTEILKRLIKTKLKEKNEIYNVCSSRPVKITKVLKIIDKCLPKKTKIKKISMQKADVLKTYGSNKKIKKITKFKNFTPIDQGVKKLCEWVLKNYKF